MMFVFKLTWLGILGIIMLILGVADKVLPEVWIGVGLYVVYMVIFHTVNPIKPWLKGRNGQAGSGKPAQPEKESGKPAQPVQPVQPPKKVIVPLPVSKSGPEPPKGTPVDLNKLCPGCMSYLADPAAKCPYCGWAPNQDNQAHMLAVGSFLAGRYMVGRSLGQGGFGITYLGWDIPRSEKIAIKEYYPNNSVNRSANHYGVEPYTTQGVPEQFARGKQKFYNEAQRLNKFLNVPGIVNVWDFFQENNTAYIVMEYVEGRTLRAYLDSLAMPLTLPDALMLLAPVADSLEQIHAAGMLHRDVNPGNIMLTPSGQAKLLDFGAARDFSLRGEHTNTINVTVNYAPEEQYLTHGNQGPWTDEYALAATIYHAVTGRKPIQAIERAKADTLPRPRSIGVNMTAQQENALMKGMAVSYQDRYKTVREFYQALSK